MTMRLGTTIIEVARDLMAAAQPVTGTRSTGKVLVRAKPGKQVFLPQNWHFIPEVNKAAREELAFKVGKGPGVAKFPEGKRKKVNLNEPDAGSWWTITDAGVLVDVVSVIGGKRHNLPGGTRMRFDPEHPDLEAVVEVQPGGLTGGADPNWLGGCMSMVQFEQLTANTVSLDAFRAQVDKFPAVVLVWDGSEPADGTTQSPLDRAATRVGSGQQLFKERFNLFVLVSRADGGHMRRNEGLKLLDDLSFWLTDRMEVDEQQFSSPTGVQIISRNRVAGDSAAFQGMYVYVLQLAVTGMWKRYDSRTFQPWLRTSSTFLTFEKDENDERKVIVGDSPVDVGEPVLISPSIAQETETALALPLTRSFSPGIAQETETVFALELTIAEWQPSSIPGLLAVHDARYGITLGTTLKSFAGGQPVITLSETVPGSGALNQALSIWVRCQLGGARGVWTFEVSTDGGTNTIARNVPSAATYDIPGTGIRLNIATGTASISNRWYSVDRTVLDQSGNGYTLTSTTDTSSPTGEVKGRDNHNDRAARGVLGHRAWVGNLTTNVLFNTTGLAAALFGGIANKPFTLMWFGQADVVAGPSGTVFVSAGSSSSGTPRVDSGIDGANDWRVSTNAGGTVPSSGDLANTAAHGFILRYDGTTLKLRVDGVEVISQVVATGTLAVDRYSILARVRTAIDAFMPGSICLNVCYGRYVTDLEANAAMAGMQSRYGWRAPRRVKLIAEGDSLTDSSLGNYPHYMLCSNDLVTLSNLATVGNTSTDIVDAGQLSALAFAVDPAGDVLNVALLLIGANDFGTDGGGPSTLSTLQANITTWCNAAYAAGVDKIIVLTNIKRGTDPGYETARLTQRSWLFTQVGVLFDRLVDLESFPGTPSDGIWYSDSTHQSAQGAIWFADEVEPAYVAVTAP
jgi:hypothetical protein